MFTMINCPYLDWIQLLVAVWCECQVKVNVCLNHVKWRSFCTTSLCCTLWIKRPCGHVCCSMWLLVGLKTARTKQFLIKRLWPKNIWQNASLKSPLSDRPHYMSVCCVCNKWTEKGLHLDVIKNNRGPIKKCFSVSKLLQLSELQHIATPLEEES